MESQTERVTDADDLTDSDEKILDELHKGARTKGALVEATGLHRNTVGYRLDVLDASGIIESIHDSTALYELVDDPRQDSTATTGDDPDLRGRLQDALEARDDQQARADRLAEDLEDCREQLEQARESASVDAQAAVVALDDLEGALDRGERHAAEEALQRAREAISDE